MSTYRPSPDELTPTDRRAMREYPGVAYDTTTSEGCQRLMRVHTHLANRLNSRRHFAHAQHWLQRANWLRRLEREAEARKK